MSKTPQRPPQPSTPALTPGRIVVGGAPEGYDALLLIRLVERARGPVLHVARDDARMAAMETALGVVAPGVPVFRLPAWDCLPYDRLSPNPAVAAERLATLAHLAEGFDRPCVILTTVNAVAQRVPPRESLRRARFAADVGSRIDLDQLQAFFAENGYVRASSVAEPGDYAIRGGVIDAFPPGSEKPVRLDLFGDMLESLKSFDPETQRSEGKLQRLELAPISETPLTPASIRLFRQRYRETFGAAGDDPLYEAVSEGRRHQGMEHWLAFFHDSLETIFDYLPEGAPVSLDHQAEEARESRMEVVRDHYDNRRQALEKPGIGGSPYRPATPASLYLTDRDWAAALADRAVRGFSPFPLGAGPNLADAGGRPGRDFAPERLQEKINLFDALAAHARERMKSGRRVVLAAYSEGSRERMGGLLEDHGLKTVILPRWGDLPAAREGAETARLLVWPLEHGFETEDLAVISEQDILGDRLVRAARKKRRADNFISEAASLSPGDLVVHVEHGVGRYLGLQMLKTDGAERDYLALEYAGEGNSRLYVPVENIELLSRFGSATEGVQLDRLGGGAWQARKARLKKQVLEIAERLIRVAAERRLRTAEAYHPASGLFEEFCARFPYQETDDQLSAISDVLGDLSAGRPMDRLICGDVGFGKTEVALRAAFVAAMEGAQVAVIAPTTLLARQHAKNFETRFRGFPLQVRDLSRFTSTKAAADTKSGLREGVVDVVVGTHALLAKDVGFKRLGLLIIDEEQHFGVKHKERLKELKSDVHVLTMTATPIPRTLQMAMTGVRELSLIATPPVDRLAIRTYVGPYDPVTTREALLREKYRGGQSFYVAPRIADLAAIEDFLREHVPEVKVAVAHGQMAAGALDEIMNAFYDGAYDVLLATTIVESGLDIPTANTLIVHRADMFGLAQLYQIRGRVGRAKTRAYAYLTTQPRKALTPAAEKRLKALASLDSLGAGFTLASHDLDIRGAGNLLGEEQSGHIREVGFELYQDMLQEALERMRSGETDLPEVAEVWSPQINLGVAALIPESYAADLDVRLGLYRRLASLEEGAELEGFAAELHDRFGPPPPEVEGLIKLIRLKGLCRRAGIARLDGGPKGASISFREGAVKNPAGVASWAMRQGALARLKPDSSLVVLRDWETPEARLKGALTLARDLVKAAESSEIDVLKAPPPPPKAPPPRHLAPQTPTPPKRGSLGVTRVIPRGSWRGGPRGGR
ncbi:transcription-repair coupling factor [Neomegalonema sp.]|uniref:transcription-repair coupling factor n=1 Tax=Neomegalonema sp. TaxID=2039713 RepID=UPI00261FC7E2|nr:transcription-repair coupling factor [Neomegalonema sp.]MDD2868614.1 transcription-repair coupling factor [Neomegalonema sp.]